MISPGLSPARAAGEFFVEAAVIAHHAPVRRDAALAGAAVFFRRFCSDAHENPRGQWAGMVHAILARETLAKLRLSHQLAATYPADERVHVERMRDSHLPRSEALLPLSRNAHDFRQRHVGMFKLYAPRGKRNESSWHGCTL